MALTFSRRGLMAGTSALGVSLATARVVSAAPPASPVTPALIEAAKKEGKVVWYTTLIVDQFVRPAVAAFERKYGVKVEYVRMDPNDIALKITAEGRAGRMQSDISDGFGMPQLVRAGFIERLDRESHAQRH